MENCKYFRCHNLPESQFDCSLCYCPFYEMCKKQKKYLLFGGYILKQNGLLACENCTYFHRKAIVIKYNQLLKNGMALEDIFKFFTDELEK
ncbi:MAG: cysteine-rich small domain-containing protein [Clostridia bacterium]